jgi:pimeloyl-ACP methyl ester carboxylesterase
MPKVTSADGTVIAYEQAGDGPPLIVVGGAFNDRGSAVALADLLARWFSVVRYDRRGRGESGDTRPYAVAREVEDLAALAAAVGGEPVLYGHSSGAGLVLHAAAAGVPAARLALYEPPFTPRDEAAMTRAGQGAEEVNALLADGRRADAVVAFMRLMGLPPQAAEGIRQVPMFPALEAMAPTLAYDLAVMDTTAGGAIPVELVRSVRAPSLLLCGAASPPWMRDTARQVAELLPRGSVRELPDQTHDVAPDVLAPVLAEFLVPASGG